MNQTEQRPQTSQRSLTRPRSVSCEETKSKLGVTQPGKRNTDSDRDRNETERGCQMRPDSVGSVQFEYAQSETGTLGHSKPRNGPKFAPKALTVS